MKLAFQFAAAFLALMVAVQPVSAAAACGMASPVSCPMGMSQMSPDCLMAQQIAEAGSIADCCNHAMPRTAAAAVAPEKRRAAIIIGLILPSVSLPETMAATAAIELPVAVSSSPPRYILYNVFRI
jgi:hypothetical protein